MRDQNLVGLSASAGIDQAHIDQAHKEHLALVRDFAILFAVVGMVAVFLSAALAVAVAAEAPIWLKLPVGVAFAFAVIIALAVVRALSFARQAIAVRLYEYQEDKEALREVAILAASRPNVTVAGRQNVVSVGSTGQTVENTRLIQVFRPSGKLVDGVPVEDLAFFCERAPIIGIAKRAWMGTTLPSGRVISRFEIYDGMVQVLVKTGLIVGREARSAGALALTDPDEMKRKLGIGPGETLRGVNPAEGEVAT